MDCLMRRPGRVVDDRAIPGHWEGAFIRGGVLKSSAIGTLV